MRKLNMMKLQALIAMIPENTHDEALRSIEAITAFPMESRARIRCILSKEFRLFIELRDNCIAITAEGRKPVICTKEDFLSKLRSTIYSIDEALNEGAYIQSKSKINIIYRPAPPSDMDIPVWDEKNGKWYDAEY